MLELEAKSSQREPLFRSHYPYKLFGGGGESYVVHLLYSLCSKVSFGWLGDGCHCLGAVVRNRFGLSRFILMKPKMILSSPSQKAGKCLAVLCFQPII